MWRLIIILLLIVSWRAPASADGLEPETGLLPTSAKQAFVMDAQLPPEFWHALDDRGYIAITGFFVGE